MRLSLTVMLLLFVAFSISSIEVQEVESELGTAYLITLGDGTPPLFAFTREQAEEIAASLEEKELLQADFEALRAYADELEEKAKRDEQAKSWLRRLACALGALVVVESVWLGVK